MPDFQHTALADSWETAAAAVAMALETNEHPGLVWSWPVDKAAMGSAAAAIANPKLPCAVGVFPCYDRVFSAQSE